MALHIELATPREVGVPSVYCLQYQTKLVSILRKLWFMCSRSNLTRTPRLPSTLWRTTGVPSTSVRILISWLIARGVDTGKEIGCADGHFWKEAAVLHTKLKKIPTTTKEHRIESTYLFPYAQRVF